MKKYIFISVLILISIQSFSKNYIPGEKLDIERIKKDCDTIRSDMDSTFHIAKNITLIWKDEVKKYGLKKTIQLNSEFFAPAIIFLILYLLWLKNRKK